MKPATMTPFLQRALSLVSVGERVMAGEMAARLWPDSPAWNRVSNVGHGAASGVAIKRRGGNVCWALWSLGYFARDGYGFRRVK